MKKVESMQRKTKKREGNDRKGEMGEREEQV